MTISLCLTIIGQGIPCDIYRLYYIKQDWQFLCCAQYACNMMSWVREVSLECAVNNSINNIQHRLTPPPRSEKKVWRKLAAEDRQESASGGKEKTQGVSVAQAEVSPFRAGTPRPHLKRQSCCGSWWRASLIGHRCQVPHALCLCYELRNGLLTLNATRLLTFSRKAEGRETLQTLALRLAAIEALESK